MGNEQCFVETNTVVLGPLLILPVYSCRRDEHLTAKIFLKECLTTEQQHSEEVDARLC